MSICSCKLLTELLFQRLWGSRHDFALEARDLIVYRDCFQPDKWPLGKGQLSASNKSPLCSIQIKTIMKEKHYRLIRKKRENFSDYRVQYFDFSIR